MEKDLLKFGYTQKWLDYGILTKEFFKEQIADQNQSGHTGWEHYRFGAFTHWLQSNASAKTIEVANFIELAEADNDCSMANSAILALLEINWLSNEQFELVKKYAKNIGDGANKNIIRTELLRTLNQKQLNEELFEKCLNKGDTHVHNALINHKDITKNMLIQLAKKGHNKKVRNVALQLSKSNKIA